MIAKKLPPTVASYCAAAKHQDAVATLYQQRLVRELPWTVFQTAAHEARAMKALKQARAELRSSRARLRRARLEWNEAKVTDAQLATEYLTHQQRCHRLSMELCAVWPHEEQRSRCEDSGVFEVSPRLIAVRRRREEGGGAHQP